MVISFKDGKFNFDIYYWKNFENRTINTEDMEKNVKNIKKKQPKTCWKGSLAFMIVSLNDRKFNFDICNWKNFENRTINTEDMEKNVKNIKIA